MPTRRPAELTGQTRADIVRRTCELGDPDRRPYNIRSTGVVVDARFAVQIRRAEADKRITASRRLRCQRSNRAGVARPLRFISICGQGRTYRKILAAQWITPLGNDTRHHARIRFGDQRPKALDWKVVSELGTRRRGGRWVAYAGLVGALDCSDRNRRCGRGFCWRRPPAKLYIVLRFGYGDGRRHFRRVRSEWSVAAAILHDRRL